MFNTEVFCKIEYDPNNPNQSVIRTNLRKSAIQEVLEAWISLQVGKGKDDRKPANKKKYNITIYYDLLDDMFCTLSDTGNDGLICGIIMDVVCQKSRLKRLSYENAF